MRSVQLWKAVRDDTGGRLNVTVFPNNQLGGDSDMLTLSKAGFYKKWKERFGNEEWSLLEQYTGPLA
ncbi:MAG: hypothetical protein NVS2B11_13660 [Acetobacteraceae bacterium]